MFYKIKLLSIITIISLCICNISVIYAEEKPIIQNHKTALYEQDLLEQYNLFLFKFLRDRLFLNALADLLDANKACDYCKLTKRHKIKYHEDNFPHYLKELGFEFDSLIFDENNNWIDWIEYEDYLPEFLGKLIFDPVNGNLNSNCNFCQLLEKLPFEDLYQKLQNKLTELQEHESINKQKQIVKIPEQFLTFKIYPKKEFEKVNALYKDIYTKLKYVKHLPNLIYKITLFKSVSEDLLISMRLIEKKDIKPIFIFAHALSNYKKLLNDNKDLLFYLKNIASIDFKVEDTHKQCTEDDDCPLIEIKKLSNIMLQIETWKKVQEQIKREEDYI